jgi:hypothetical protein
MGCRTSDAEGGGEKFEWHEPGYTGKECQIPFMVAASRALREPPSACPRRGAALRAYFHIINRSQSTGSIWVWCGSCGIHVTLPRVKPTRSFVDHSLHCPTMNSLHSRRAETRHSLTGSSVCGTTARCASRGCSFRANSVDRAARQVGGWRGAGATRGELVGKS